MPDKPIWAGQLDQAIDSLRALPDPWVDCGVLAELLGVGRRRAQQLLVPCITRRLGANGLALREIVVSHLQSLVSGDALEYERRRRQRLAEQLERARLERPRLLVEAPQSIVRQELAGLPAGIEIACGRIIVEFTSVDEALQKLLALAMAIGNDISAFEAAALDNATVE